MNEKQNVRANY